MWKSRKGGDELVEGAFGEEISSGKLRGRGGRRGQSQPAKGHPIKIKTGTEYWTERKGQRI